MKRALLLVLALTTATLSTCGRGDDMPEAMASVVSTTQFPQNAGMWIRLDEDASAPAVISKVVDDAVFELLVNPRGVSYFTSIGGPGHDTVGHLKTCLDLRLKALFGGPFSYPGQVAADGITVICDDTVTAHPDVGIPGCVSDQSITNVATVMKTDGVPGGYISRIAPMLIGLEPTIMLTVPQYLGPNTAQNYE